MNENVIVLLISRREKSKPQNQQRLEKQKDVCVHAAMRVWKASTVESERVNGKKFGDRYRVLFAKRKKLEKCVYPSFFFSFQTFGLYQSWLYTPTCRMFGDEPFLSIPPHAVYFKGPKLKWERKKTKRKNNKNKCIRTRRKELKTNTSCTRWCWTSLCFENEL